ncbi:MAG: RNA methyltransferase [Methanosarcinales archaeon]|nr:RNA methyltransferase [Methanosarcinales archaeon]
MLRIVLIEPLYEGNVGSVARAMKNFGHDDLVLVNPCELGGQARALASHATDLLDGARIVETIGEALDGSHLVIGATGIIGIASNEHMRMPYTSPKQLGERLNGISDENIITLLFGREDNGLYNDELKLCEVIVNIPLSAEYPIMNLSHAVAILLYELSHIKCGEIELAETFDRNLLYAHLDELLHDLGYPPHKHQKTVLMLKRIFGRANLMPREVQTLRGILKLIQKRSQR